MVSAPFPARHLFFDLDHTLWDYERNSVAALEILYHQHRLQHLGLHPKERFFEAFRKANLQVWDLFDENRMNSTLLRHKRLELVFEQFEVEPVQIEGFHEGYYQHCSSGLHLISGALDLLDYLFGRYRLHIITNGFNDSQFTKLERTGLMPYFETVTTSESANSKKPDIAFFEYALSLSGAHKNQCVVIGDGLRTDVAGALGFGLPVIWFNPQRLTPPPNITAVQSLGEIPALLYPVPQGG